MYEQLREMGFFRLLNIVASEPPQNDNQGGTTAILPFVTDAEVSPEVAEEFVDKLVALIGGTISMDDKSQRYLFGALIEAMKNSIEHAYKMRPAYQSMTRRWWLTGSFDRSAGEVVIVLFDQGIGIPSTLEPDLIDLAEAVAKLDGLRPSHGLMIEIATRAGRTSTDQLGRGQGFATMRKFIDHCDDGELVVFSDRGHYMYSRRGTTRKDYVNSLGGTLIQLRMRHTSSVVRIEP